MDPRGQSLEAYISLSGGFCDLLLGQRGRGGYRGSFRGSYRGRGGHRASGDGELDPPSEEEEEEDGAGNDGVDGAERRQGFRGRGRCVFNASASYHGGSSMNVDYAFGSLPGAFSWGLQL